MHKLVAIGIGLMILGIGLNTWAAEAVTMDEVVVTATKTEEQRKDVSNSLVVKDSLDIQEAPAKNLGQLLANEAGIDWRSYGDYGGASQTFMIRGMEQDEALVMVNGLALNSPSLAQADVSGILLNNIERVEVVKGSGSLLYGSGAMAGTVNIITKEPTREQMDLVVRAGYGTQNTYQLSAENGMFVLDDLGYYLTTNRLETGGHRDNGDLVHNDASLKLLLDKGEILNISLYGQIVDRKAGAPGIKPPDSAAAPTNGEYYSRESASLRDNTKTQDTHALLAIESKPSDWLRWRMAGDYTHTDSIHEGYLNAASWTQDAGEGLYSRIRNKVLGVEANVEIKPLKGATLLLGADHDDHEWDSESVELNTDGSKDPTSADPRNADIDTQGVFGEVQYRPSKYFKLHGGFRHQRHSTFGTEDLPRYGIILNPWQTTAIKYNRGKHFKAPTPNDLFWPEDDFSRGNEDLDPQTGWHSDVTVEQQILGNKLFLTGTYFAWDIEGKIDWAENPAYPGPFGDKWTPTNLNSSSAFGWEAGVDYNPNHHLTLSAAYTYTDAEEVVGDIKRRAKYVPKQQYKAAAIYRCDFGLTVSASLRYMGERYYYQSDTVKEPDEILKAYSTVDLRLEQRLGDHWILTADGRNLFDAAYDTYISNFVDSGGTRVYGSYTGAGRSVFFAVTYEY